jgi:hypothetical protein
MSYMKQMQELYKEFCDKTGKLTASTREMARWAILNDKWKRHEEAALKQCAQDFADALRENYETDPRGRRVRVNHSARIKRGSKFVSLWGDMRKVEHEFVVTALKQRRGGMVGDAYQLKQDTDSYNEFYNKSGSDIQMPLDLTDDVLELEQMEKERAKKKAA